jgi:hypothetical protein
MKTSEFAVVLVVILAAATVIGGELYYRNAPPASRTVGATTSNVEVATSPTPSPEGLQVTGSVSSVDSGGGHFSISDVGFGINYQTGSSNPTVLVVGLSPSQTQSLRYGQDVEGQLTYVPTQQTMFDSYGKVTLVSSSGGCPPTALVYTSTPQLCAVIDLVNPTMPTAVPISWKPNLGDEVTLTISPESGTPIVAITGLQSKAWTSQFSVSADSPSCLSTPPCVMIANGARINVNLTLYYYCSYPCPVSVTTSDSAFTISGVQQSSSMLGQEVSFILTIPNSDYTGDIHLSFSSTSS